MQSPFASPVSTSLDFVLRLHPQSELLYSNHRKNQHYYTVVSGELLSSADLNQADKQWLELMMDLEPGTLSAHDSHTPEHDNLNFQDPPHNLGKQPTEEQEAQTSPQAGDRKRTTSVKFNPHDDVIADKCFPKSPSGVIDATGEGWTAPALDEIQI